MRNNTDLIALDLTNVHIVAQVSGAAFNLDAIVEELLERREIEDLVADGLATVDDIFLGDFLLGGFLAAAGLGERK